MWFLKLDMYKGNSCEYSVYNQSKAQNDIETISALEYRFDYYLRVLLTSVLKELIEEMIIESLVLKITLGVQTMVGVIFLFFYYYYYFFVYKVKAMRFEF